MEAAAYIDNDYNTSPYFNSSDVPHLFEFDSEHYDWDELYDMIDDSEYVNTDFDKFFHYQRVRRIVFGFILIVLIIIGLLGNVLVVFSACRKNRHGSSAFYVFLVNMCIASMVLLAFEYPLLLYENVFTQPWKMGKLFCQLHGYIQYCAFYGTAYALVIVLLFRLLEVTLPDRVMMMNNTCTASVICTIKWAVIMIANIPTWIGHGLYDEIEGRSFCYHKQLNDNESHLHKYLIIHFTFAFAFPCVLMVAIMIVLTLKALSLPTGNQYSNICNHQRLQRNTAIMLTGLIAAFILCWGPTNIYLLLLGFEIVDLSDFLPLSIISDIFMSLACANPAVNPWIIVAALRHELLPSDRQTRVPTSETNTQNCCQNGNGNVVVNGNVFAVEPQHNEIIDTEMDLV